MTATRQTRRRMPADVLDILSWACRHFDGVGAGRYGEGTLEQIAAREVAPVSMQGYQIWLDQNAHREGLINDALEAANIFEHTSTEAVATLNQRTNRSTHVFGARVAFEDWRAHLRITQAPRLARDVVAGLEYQCAVNALRAGQPALNPLGVWDMGRALDAGESAESFVARLTALQIERAPAAVELVEVVRYDDDSGVNDFEPIPSEYEPDALFTATKEGRAALAAEPAPIEGSAPASPPSDLATALRESIEREQRERIENTPLMGFVGSWDGYAQKPLKDVPVRVLMDARRYFTAELAKPVGDRPSEELAHRRMSRQLAAIVAMLPRDVPPPVVAPIRSFEDAQRRLVGVAQRSGVGFQVASAAIRWNEVD